MAFQSGFWITYFVPIALLASYLCMGYLAGKKIIEFKSLRRKPALITAAIFTVFEIVVLVALFVIRCYGEVQRSGGMGDGGLGFSFGSSSTGALSLGKASSSTGLSAFVDKVSDLGVDVLFPAIALSLIMFIGALLEMCTTRIVPTMLMRAKRSASPNRISPKIGFSTRKSISISFPLPRKTSNTNGANASSTARRLSVRLRSTSYQPSSIA